MYYLEKIFVYKGISKKLLSFLLFVSVVSRYMHNPTSKILEQPRESFNMSMEQLIMVCVIRTLAILNLSIGQIEIGHEV